VSGALQKLAPQRTSRALLGFLGTIACAGFLVILLDRHEIVRVLGLTDYRSILLALVATAASYLALSVALVATGELMEVRAPRGPLMRAAFVSEVLNHVVSLGGVAGYSVRAAMMARQNVKTGDVLAMSLLHSYLNNTVLAGLLLVALFLLHAHADLPLAVQAGTLVLGAVTAAFTVASTAVLLSRRVRGAFLGGAAAVASALSAGWRNSHLALADLETTLARGAESFRQRPSRAVLPVALVGLYWMLQMLTFWLCLHAFRQAVPPAQVMSGFTIGISAGFMSFLPGGVGVQEGTLVGTFSVLGVPAEQAALAALLFRVVFFFAPYVVSLPLYLEAALSTTGAGGASLPE
jgi:uncharacterized protein (TIRG00374 family)